MKKFLIFYVSFIGFLGCSSYKIKNNAGEDVKAGDTTVEAGQCADLSGGFFGIGSDFPFTVTKVNGEDAIGGENEDKNNYIVTADKVTAEDDEEKLECPDEDEEQQTAEEKAKGVFKDIALVYSCTKGDGVTEDVNQGPTEEATVATLVPYFEDGGNCVVKEDAPQVGGQTVEDKLGVPTPAPAVNDADPADPPADPADPPADPAVSPAVSTTN